MKRWLTIGLICGGVAVSARGAEAQDWPMWGYDAARSGIAPAALALPETLHLQWMRELPPPRRAWPAQQDDRSKLEFDVSYTPIAMNGRVFVTSMNNDSLTAYRLDTGEELWRFYADGPARLAPAAWDGKIYFGSDDGRLYCVDAATGKELWRFQAAPTDHRALGNTRLISQWPVRGGPAVADGTVYFAAGVWPMMGTFAFALDARNGAVQWANTGHGTDWQRQPHSRAVSFAGFSPQGYVAVGDDYVVAAGGRAWPVVFNRRDGTHHRASGAGYRVRVEGDLYYMGNRSFRLRDGGGHARYTRIEHKAIAALNARVRSVSGQVEGGVYTRLVAGGRLLIASRTGRLYCFGPDAPAVPKTFAHAPTVPKPDDTQAGRQAAAILEEAGVTAGYALLLSSGDGALAEQLAVRSDLHVVVLEPDRANVETARHRLDRAGLYGERASVIPGRLSETRIPPYVWSLILAPDPAAVGLTASAETLESLYNHLRPYGGKALLAFEANHAQTRAALAGFQPQNGRAEAGRSGVLLVREGGLPGAGTWTHQYADPAQTSNSGDQLVRPPFGVLWYGGPTNHDILPRHTMGPRPQVKAGRLVILGFDKINARCVFTGRELWSRAMPGIGDPFVQDPDRERKEPGRGGAPKQPGATYIGSPYVTLADAVYLRHQGRILRLDPETGATVAEWALPTREPTEEVPDWGHISVQGDALITTLDPHIFRGGRLGSHTDDRWDGTSSARLAVLDRHSGKVLWTRDAQMGFRHNAIASGNGRLYVSDRLSDKAVNMARRRGMTIAEQPRLLALDLKTGRELWSTESEVFGAFLNYSVEHDLLVEGNTSDGVRLIPGEAANRFAVRRGANGELVWNRGEGLGGPVILRHDTMVSPGGRGASGRVLSLSEGQQMRREHPVTGGQREIRYWRAHGCGMSNAGDHVQLFRSGAAGFADMTGGSGTGSLGGFRASCTANLVPANGVLNAPDYTRTCSCAYQLQTSLGLVHMPEMDVWVANRQMPGFGGSIQRLGVNLGAPGNRLADNGIFWVHFPHEAPSPRLDLLISAVDAADTPVRIVEAVASDGDAAATLDGDPNTAWRVRSERSGRFSRRGPGAWVRYDLSEPTQLDNVEVQWSGPPDTEFRIEVSLDGETWTKVAGETDKGPPARTSRRYRFDSVQARHLRFVFARHGQESREFADISQVVLGGLADPEAYGFFRPKRYWRDHSLTVDGANGLNWVAASGVNGIRELRLDGVDAVYDVALHFAEPDGLAAGERRFSIAINGQTLVPDFDVAREAGGPGRAVVKRFENIKLENRLRLAFDPAAGSKHPPILSGVELLRQE